MPDFSAQIQSDLVLLEPNKQPKRVSISISVPVEESDDRWKCYYRIKVGHEDEITGWGPGVDGLDALVSGLTVLAVETKRLRKRGQIVWHGRNDGYICLDQLIRGDNQ
jgi:hypothetical protein